MRFIEFKQLTEAYDPEVAELQKALRAAGADLGSYGPNRDGIDGVMGPYTRRAANKYPDVAKKFTNVLNKPDVKELDSSAKDDPDFNSKLKKVAAALGIEESTLRAIIKHESNFNPAAEDPAHVSVGLIGFTERTARGMGTSKEELKKMTATQQLDYVYKFYQKVGVKPGMDRGTIYMLTFMPAFVNAPDDTVLGKQGGGNLITPSGLDTKLSMHKVWLQNPVFGKSKGKDHFTVGDVKKSVERTR